MFIRLAQQHRQFVKDLVMNLQALAIVLENRGYLASCYTCGSKMNSASFMVSLKDNHLIRFLVSDYGITWTEMRDDRELMKLEGAEAIAQLQDLADSVKYQVDTDRNNQERARESFLENTKNTEAIGHY
ncbi:MAG: DUF1815 family protein [Prochloraceae cyanobacterium]